MNDAGRRRAALEAIERRYGRGERSSRCCRGRAFAQAGRVGGADRALGRRQVDPPASRGPARAARRRRGDVAGQPTST